MESYYETILRNHITGSCYGIIVRNDIMESYYRIIFMKRVTGMPGTSPEPPGIPGIPCACTWEPRGRPRDPRGRSCEPQGTPLGPAGTFLRRPRDALGTPGASRDPLWTTKNAESQQLYSASSSRFLRSKLLVRAHRIKDSTGPFYL